jgi:UPF0716 family protein affecting phage T7 exclusion
MRPYLEWLIVIAAIPLFLIGLALSVLGFIVFYPYKRREPT